MLLGGTNPETLTLRDWLDAGERMLTQDVTDPVLLSAFGRLFQAEAEDTVTEVFAELGMVGEHYAAEFHKAEDEARRKMGVPRSVAVSDLARAQAEWGVPAGLEKPDGDED